MMLTDKIENTFYTIIKIVCILFLVSLISYGFVYLLLEPQEVIQLMTKNYPNLYNFDKWQNDFISLNLKSSGNKWAIIAIFLSLYLIWIVVKSSFKFTLPKSIFTFSWHNYAVLLLIGLIIALISYVTPPAYDEVFSAYFFAAKSPILSWVYYPLPNNHILFNIINGLISKFGFNPLTSARFLSVVCTLLLTIRLQRYVQKGSEDKILSALIVVGIILSWPLIGFSFQGRGYAMLALISWLSLENWLEFLSKNDVKSYKWHWIWNVVGICVVPSYLYQIIGFGILHLFFYQRFVPIVRKILPVCGYSIIVMFLFYFPSFSISGMNSFTSNKYVKPEGTPLFSFIQNLYENNYITGMVDEWLPLPITTPIGGIISFLFILLMLFFHLKKGRHFYIVISIFGLLLGFIIMLLVMKKFPFYRNLIHYAMLVNMMILLLLQKPFRYKPFSYIILSVFLSMEVIQFVNFHPFKLYYYDLENTYKNLKSTTPKYLQGKKIWIHDEAFYNVVTLPYNTYYQLGGVPDTSIQYAVVRKALPMDSIWTLKEYWQEYAVYESKK